MSVTKTKNTQYHEDPQDVKFKISQLNIRSLDNLESLTIHGKFSGKVGNTTGEVESKTADIDFSILTANFTPAEKGAAKTFVRACERELAKVEAELADEAQVTTDIFV